MREKLGELLGLKSGLELGVEALSERFETRRAKNGVIRKNAERKDGDGRS